MAERKTTKRAPVAAAPGVDDTLPDLTGDSLTTGPIGEEPEPTNEEPETTNETPEPTTEPEKDDTPDIPQLGAPIPATPVASTIPEIDLQRAKARYQRLSTRSAELKQVIEEAQADQVIVTRELTSMAHLFETPVDPKANQKGIMAYIQSQNALRREQLTRRAEVLQGFKLEEVLPGASQLDQSMTRRTGFGGMRMQRPLMKKPGG